MDTCRPGKTHFPTAHDARVSMLRILARPSAWERKRQPVKHYACPCGAGFVLTSWGPGPGTPRSADDARAMLAAALKS